MPESPEYEIWSHNLTKIFPGTRDQPPVVAVDGIDLRVRRGIHGFLGPNGAGKSSTINMLVGVSHITKGEASIHGFPSGSTAAKKVLGFLPQDPVFPEHMEAREYLVFMGRISGVSETDARVKALELLEYFDLSDAARRKVKTFSGGMKQKLGLIATLMHNPDIIILDEPTANLDPEGREQLIKTIKSLSTRVTAFISSHILAEIEQMADSVTILHKGQIVASDSVAHLKHKHSGTTLILQTNNNMALLPSLRDIPAVGSAWIGVEGDLFIKPRNLEEIALLQDLLPRLVLELGFTLRGFSQPTLSLQDIFLDLMHFNKVSETQQGVP